MTEAVSLKPDFGRFGVWTFGAAYTRAGCRDREAGIWRGMDWRVSRRRPGFVEPILEKTETCRWPPGSSSLDSAAPNRSRSLTTASRDAYPGRFVLGIGIGHPEHTEEYRKPYDVLVEYLDALDAAKVPTSRRVVAALGPKVLKLAAQRSAGAHPYLTTPEHTAQAHELIGNTVFLAPEHKVVLTDRRRRGPRDRPENGRLLSDLSNYLNNWKRLGFTDEDLTKPGSDKLIDAVVALRHRRRHRRAAQRAPRARAPITSRSRCWAGRTNCCRR